jgi:hypothetical protein
VPDENPVTPLLVSCAAAAFARAAGYGLAFIAATAAAYGAGVAGGYTEAQDDLAAEPAGLRGDLSAEALLRTRANLLAA